MGEACLLARSEVIFVCSVCFVLFCFVFGGDEWGGDGGGGGGGFGNFFIRGGPL